MLPGATVEQIVATGFHRNTLVNEEGGTDPEQFRVESVVDRVSTTGAVFLGLTIGCAQCHDHKFDPDLATRVLPVLRPAQQRGRACVSRTDHPTSQGGTCVIGRTRSS